MSYWVLFSTTHICKKLVHYQLKFLVNIKIVRTYTLISYLHIVLPLSYVEGDLDEAEEEEELLTEIEVEQAPPVVPIPAPVEPPVKRKRGRPPKNKPDSK